MMCPKFRLDIRYIPSIGGEQAELDAALTSSLSAAGFAVEKISLPDGNRISIVILPSDCDQVELRLLAVAAEHGTIGRFSCEPLAQE